MSDDLDGEENYMNPILPPELQEKEHLLHADCIEGTAYSKVWVLKTLQELYKQEAVRAIEKGDEDEEEEEMEKGTRDEEENESGEDLVNDDLQNDLCQLWDMSMDSSVAQFLMDSGTVNILLDVINKSRVPRITEICVGILGNMACESPICKAMSENAELVDMSLALLSSSDTGTLVENTRLIQTSLVDPEAGKVWLASIKAVPDVRNRICFILASALNLTLLKSTAGLLDTLLDKDDNLCRAWANQELVEAVLEGVKQSKSEMLEQRAATKPEDTTLATFLHVFQLFSTCEDGVQALVRCAEDVQAPLLSYLHQVCSYEIVDVDEATSCLASAISVLHTLYTSSPVVRENLMSSSHFHRYLTKILEPLYPVTHDIMITETGEPIVEGLGQSPQDAAAFRHRMSRESADSYRRASNGTEEESASRKRKASDALEHLEAGANEGKGDSALQKRSASGGASHVSSDGDKAQEEATAEGDARHGGDGEAAPAAQVAGSVSGRAETRFRQPEDETLEEREQSERHHFLFGIIQGFLGEVVASYDLELKAMKRGQGEGEENSAQGDPLFLPVLRYIDRHFSHKRLIYMLLTLEPVVLETDSPVQRPIRLLLDIADHFKLFRLKLVIKDFSSARGLSFMVSPAEQEAAEEEEKREVPAAVENT